MRVERDDNGLSCHTCYQDGVDITDDRRIPIMNIAKKPAEWTVLNCCFLERTDWDADAELLEFGTGAGREILTELAGAVFSGLGPDKSEMAENIDKSHCKHEILQI